MATSAEQHTFRVFLRILAVAQFVMVVLAGSALGLVFMIYGDTAARAANPNHAAEMHALASYRPAFLCLATLSVLAMIGGFFSGLCIWRQRARGFSIAVAVVSLFLFPVGTVIGLATLIALGQKPIRELYHG